MPKGPTWHKSTLININCGLGFSKCIIIYLPPPISALLIRYLQTHLRNVIRVFVVSSFNLLNLFWLKLPLPKTNWYQSLRIGSRLFKSLCYDTHNNRPAQSRWHINSWIHNQQFPNNLLLMLWSEFRYIWSGSRIYKANSCNKTTTRTLQTSWNILNLEAKIGNFHQT